MFVQNNNLNIKVSVIIPVYNAEGTLRKCLDSVFAQKYLNLEIVLVDNNSNDGTKDILKGYELKDSRIKYVFAEKKGRGSARNAGVNASSGEIIVMTDADCVVPENWIEQMISPIVNDGEIVVMGGEYDLVENFWSRNIQKANSEFLTRVSDGKYIKMLDTKNFAIKAEVIKRINFDITLTSLEDYDLYLRLRRVFRILFLKNVRVGHIHRNTILGLMRQCFQRARGACIIKRKYTSIEISDEPMLESVSARNFITFPFWMIGIFIRKSPSYAFYILVSELAWRAGIISDIFRRR